MRARQHASSAVSVGVGLGLVVSLSAQRQQQGTSLADSLESRDSNAASSRASKPEDTSEDTQGKNWSFRGPTLREDVSKQQCEASKTGRCGLEA